MLMIRQREISKKVIPYIVSSKAKLSKRGNCQKGKLSAGQTFKKANCHKGKLSKGQTVKRTNRQKGTLSKGQTVKRAHFQKGKLSKGQTVDKRSTAVIVLRQIMISIVVQ